MLLYSINEDHNEENEQRQVFRRSLKVITKLKAIISRRAHECNLRQTARRVVGFRKKRSSKNPIKSQSGKTLKLDN
jgi:hypothetical protein